VSRELTPKELAQIEGIELDVDDALRAVRSVRGRDERRAKRRRGGRPPKPAKPLAVYIEAFWACARRRMLYGPPPGSRVGWPSAEETAAEAGAGLRTMLDTIARKGPRWTWSRWRDTLTRGTGGEWVDFGRRDRVAAATAPAPSELTLWARQVAGGRRRRRIIPH
jgi:hypothetical protein